MTTPLSWVGRLRRSNVGTVATGAALAQLIGVAAAPALSRLYTPAEFGTFVIVSSIALAVGTVACLRYELAIPLPERDGDGRALMSVSAIAACLTCSTLAAVCWLLRDLLVAAFGSAVSEPALMASFAIALAVALYRLTSQWALRMRRYAHVARRNVLQSSVTIGVQLTSGIAGWAGGLAAGLAAGQLTGALATLHGTRPRATGGDVPSYRSVASRYRRFPLHMAPAGVLNVAGLYLPILLLAGLYGPVVAGYVGFTQRILGLPMTLIGQSVAQVYLGELSSVKREGGASANDLFWRATKRLSAVAAVLTVALLIAGPLGFSVAFGSEWRPAGEMSQALGFALAGQLVASTLSHTLVVYERTSVSFAWDAFRLVIVTAAVAVTAWAGLDSLAAVWAFAGATLMAYGVLWELCRRTVRSGRA